MNGEQDYNNETVSGEGVAQPQVATQQDQGQDLAEQLAQAQAQATEYLDNWRRSAAELANARKRMQREREEIVASAAARVLEKLLPILDDVDRAFKAVPPDEADSDWVSGFRMIQRKLHALLDSEGVRPIPTEGQKFDPAVHYAVSHEPHDTLGEGDIIEELAGGYKLGDRVLRPSMVRVAKGNEEG